MGSFGTSVAIGGTLLGAGPIGPEATRVRRRFKLSK
jgi:hypothetical protein